MNTVDQQRRILWVAPNFNHYKKNNLIRLARDRHVDLVVLAGRTAVREGYKDDNRPVPFDVIEISAQKRWLAFHPASYAKILKCALARRFDVIMIPLEKKLLPLVLWGRILRVFLNFKLVSYNHPVIRSRRDCVTPQDLAWTRRFFRLYDRVVFYTEAARDKAVEQALIPANKAHFANNTLDTDLISRHYEFEINQSRPLRLLFIGRLVERKRVDLLLNYYDALKRRIPDLELTVIGEGPEAARVSEATLSIPGIHWPGALVDEAAISMELRRAHAVFVPGESGLSIVHALAYGKPYITLDLPAQAHAPELVYLRNGENGLLLNGSFADNCARIKRILTEPNLYAQYCRKAFETAQDLSIEHWCEQMAGALFNAAGRIEHAATD